MHSLGLFAGWSDVPIELGILSLAVASLPIFIIWGVVAAIQKVSRSPQNLDAAKSQKESDPAVDQQSAPGRILTIEKPRTPAWKITFFLIMGTYALLTVALIIVSLLSVKN